MLTAADVEAVVIGASAGAIDALSTVLPSVVADTRVPVIVVVHVPAHRPSLLTSVFRHRCAAPVAEPDDKQPIAPGIWFAPPDYHLLVERDRTFALSDDEPVHFSRPSIDVLFESAAAVYGVRLVAIVLTGASADGARGARAVRDAGGFVLVQDPATAEMPVMPRAAQEAADPHAIEDLPGIARALGALTGALT